MFPKENLYLLSYGSKEFQGLKLINSGIAEYFKKIIISDKLKSSALGKLIKEEKINKREILYFLDDKISHLEDVKKKYPFIITILIKRKDGRYNCIKNKYCDYEIKNLREMMKIIKNLK